MIQADLLAARSEILLIALSTAPFSIADKLEVLPKPTRQAINLFVGVGPFLQDSCSVNVFFLGRS